MVVAYVVPATFGPALLRILGAPPFQLLVLQRAAAAAIDLVSTAAAPHGLKISGLLVSRHSVVELIPA